MLHKYYQVGLLQSLWFANNKVNHSWVIPEPCAPFQATYDEIQEQFQALSVTDELLSGVYTVLLIITSAMGLEYTT